MNELFITEYDRAFGDDGKKNRDNFCNCKHNVEEAVTCLRDAKKFVVNNANSEVAARLASALEILNSIEFDELFVERDPFEENFFLDKTERI
jgi:hypothetical protein